MSYNFRKNENPANETERRKKADFHTNANK